MHGLIGKWQVQLMVLMLFQLLLDDLLVSWKESCLLFLCEWEDLADPSAVAGFELNASVTVTSALTTQIIHQQNNFNVTVFSDQCHVKILWNDSSMHP